MNEPLKSLQITAEETQRIKALYAYEILDTPPEQAFDDLVELASQICETPVSLVTLLDQERQWFKAKVGIAMNETPREQAFCNHAIHSDQIMIVRDTLLDERFLDHPLVLDDPNIRFYAGMPLITQEGHRLGTLCVIDMIPRELKQEQIFALKVLSRQVMQQIELKLHLRNLEISYEKIYQQNKDLKRIGLVSNKLISIISHDLRSPLTTMKGFINLFKSDQLNTDEINHFRKGISDLLDSSTDLLENLMQWGVSQMEEEGIKIQPVRLDTLIQEVISHLEMAAHQKKNAITYELPMPYELKGDAMMIRFIIRNLLQNANKFTSDGKIEIYVQQDTAFHAITVKDNGTGIREKQLDMLFRWENKVSTRGTSGEKGAGLGLLVCKEFVEMHGGSMQVTSKPGEGSAFTFTLNKNI